MQPTSSRPQSHEDFSEEIFGPVVSVTTFKTEADALEIANDNALRPRRGPLEPRRQPLATRWAAPFRQAASGPTATTPIRRTRPSEATSNPALAARRIA